MKMMPAAVTLKDIAAKSGVSATTISRILSGRDTGIPMARSLRDDSRRAILGVILRDIFDPFHIRVLKGIDDAANRRGYRLVLGHVDFRPDVAVAYDHLWNLGHRNIICVSDPRMRDGRHRVEIYQQYMSEHGIENKMRVYLSSQDPEASYQVGEEIFASFNSPDRPTAIYAASNTITIYLMQAVFQADISMADHISIIGFDNIDITRFTIPPLTTINQSGVEMGQSAANLLLGMIEQNQATSEVSDIVLSPTLVVRQSTRVPTNS